MPRRICHITPPLGSEDPEYNDTSSVEPTDSETSDSDWIEVDDKEWNDEQLKDDARPGRRRGKLDQITSASDRVSSEKKEVEKALRQKSSTAIEDWEVVMSEECWPSTVDVRDQEVARARIRKRQSRSNVLSCFNMLALRE